MIDVADAVGGNEALVLKLVRAMETGDLPEAIKAVCTEGFVWVNSGLAVINGQAELFEQMARGGFAGQIPILKTMTHFSAELIHIASKGRYRFYRTGGSSLGRAGSRLDDTPYLWEWRRYARAGLLHSVTFYDVACYRQAPTEAQGGLRPGFLQSRRNQMGQNESGV